MTKIQTEIIIQAPVSQVWNTLMDFDDYPNWNPFIKEIGGSQKVGARLTAFIQPKDQQPMKFQPLVLVNEKEKEFRWIGHLFVKGLFDGEHYFHLSPINANSTKFIHGEHFSGVLVYLILKLIKENTIKGFKAMNEALKKKVEYQ